MYHGSNLGGACEADQLDPLVLCHLHSHICAGLGNLVENIDIALISSAMGSV